MRWWFQRRARAVQGDEAWTIPTILPMKTIVCVTHERSPLRVGLRNRRRGEDVKGHSSGIQDQRGPLLQALYHGVDLHEKERQIRSLIEHLQGCRGGRVRRSSNLRSLAIGRRQNFASSSV